MRITASKNLPHRENGSPAGTSTGGPQTTSRRDSKPLVGRRRLRSSVSHLAGAGASAPAASISLVRGRSAATGQRPRRLGLIPATRLWCRGKLVGRDGLTWCRRGRGVSAGAVRPAWPLLLCSRSGGVGVASRRDAIPSESSLSSSLSPPSSSLGDSSSGSPLCLDLARRASSAWRSRFFFFFPFFSESLVDFCFSTDWRRLSRSTSSSRTGGLEDRTSIRPCQNKGKVKKGSKEIQNQSHVQEKSIPGRSSPHQASWGSH